MKDLSSLQHFVGCDVSKSTLDFALYERGKDYRMFQHIQVSNSEDGFRAMRKWLRSFKIKIQDIVIAMEHTGSYSTALAEWCYKKSITFVFLHPIDVKNACNRGRNKTDRIDAQFIADYVYTMREKLTPSAPESPVIKRLRQLRNERELAVRSRTSYINQRKVVTDSCTARRLEKMILIFSNQIKIIEAAIKDVVDSDDRIRHNYELLLSIPGIGMINAVTTIIATGNFTRFQTARQYAKFCCVCPLSYQSGSSIRGKDRVSHAGHNEIKSVLTIGARSAITHDQQLKAYYERKRAEGKSHGCVMNAVKFKLICRMFAVIRRQTDYVDTERFRS
ncbi:MAG: transposase [Duncaniella sp.]|nr:transposase [Duncaniella sp.]